MSLREERCQFTELLCVLVQEMVRRGYKVAFDEGTEHLTAKDPTSDHKVGSKHHEGLAMDILLYKPEYLRRTEDYEEMGLFWESLNPKCTWGGRFRSPDGNHVSWNE